MLLRNDDTTAREREGYSASERVGLSIGSISAERRLKTDEKGQRVGKGHSDLVWTGLWGFVIWRGKKNQSQERTCYNRRVRTWIFVDGFHD